MGDIKDGENGRRGGVRSARETGIPMSPENRLKVLGILVCGFTSIKTFFCVRTYTCSFPALLSGLSSRVSKH